jgi:hypothetical protein
MLLTSRPPRAAGSILSLVLLMPGWRVDGLGADPRLTDAGREAIESSSREKAAVQRERQPLAAAYGRTGARERLAGPDSGQGQPAA